MLFGLGCSDNTIAKIQIRKPEILVHPDTIDFENIVSGTEVGSETFSIINVGDEDLYVSPPVLIDGSTRFDIRTFEEEILIPAGELVDVELFYTPKTYEHNGAFVEVVSNDEDEPLIKVLIEGQGDAPVLDLNPEGHDFGTISIGCDNELRLTLANVGNLPLTISNVQQMVTQPVDINMFFGTLPDLPWTIDPGFELDIITSYTPSDIGNDSSVITVESNDPLNPTVDFEEMGEGQVEQWVIDLHEQGEVPLLDVLWVIDNSGSMNPFQQALADNISDFMTIFLAASPDYHMAFITTDDYQFQGFGQIDNSTQNPELMASSTLSTIGIGGSGHEKGIEYSKKATSASGPASEVSGFLRPDATLVVIYVSDEPDYSTGGWNNYVSHFSALKDPDKLHMISIVGDDPQGCIFSYNNLNRNVQYGEGYIDITNYFNGTVYSLCSQDWGLQMQDLAETVSSRRRFSLSEDDPIETTIEVYVNGQLASTGWSYDVVENWVQFDTGFEPDPGDTIEIKYATWGCE